MGKDHQLNRRLFLKGLATVSGGLVLEPLGSGSLRAEEVNPPVPRSADTLSVGVCLPRSRNVPHAGENFSLGLRLGIESGDLEPDLHIEEVDPGISSLATGIRKVAADSRLHLLTGIAGAPAIPSIHPILETLRIPFVANSAGANRLRRDERSPHVFHNTLAAWQASRFMGEWAARHLGPRALLAMDFYESGYDLPAAFRAGYEAAGGSIIETRVTGIPPQYSGCVPVIDAIRHLQPDVVATFYSGPEAATFLRLWSEADLGIPLVSSPFGWGPDAFRTPDVRNEIYTVTSWWPTLPDRRNSSFPDMFHARSGHPPDPFALLGYETGQWAAAARRHAGRRNSITGDHLRRTLPVGPRGIRTLNPETRMVTSTLHVLQVAGSRVCTDPRCLLSYHPERGDSAGEPPDGPLRTGWTNSYLFV